MAKKKAKKTTKAKKTPKVVAFKEGQKVKRIDIFRLFEDDDASWKRWDKKKSGWVKIPYKSKVKDLEFKIVKVKLCDANYTMYWAESKNWKIRWLKKPNNGWGFLNVMSKEALKDN